VGEMRRWEFGEKFQVRVLDDSSAIAELKILDIKRLRKGDRSNPLRRILKRGKLCQNLFRDLFLI